MTNKRKTSPRASKKKTPLPKKTKRTNEIIIKGEITLPDMNEIIKNQFVCPHCKTTKKGYFDINQFLASENARSITPPDLLKRMLSIDYSEINDYFTGIKCVSCEGIFIIDNTRLANLVTTETIINTWNNTRQVTLENNKLTLL